MEEEEEEEEEEGGTLLTVNVMHTEFTKKR
ncbi:hypothetical protein VAS14_08690 [Vibrio angustum S14]|uniref:Uncharacterized protein n=1 Tax=Photobacterium angustum (strain S14 / CCUG 15956) TaxID=314292 RepID=Q1ZN02_PHOAS|nr:hypothetical protein VAS14_08690 [Vibrio angustum S14] [Photobacterium angustum S14]